MGKLPEILIRSVSVIAALTCCLLLIGPLYLVFQPDGITPSAYYVSMFDLPAVWLGVDSGLMQMVMRGGAFLLAIVTTLACGFSGFRWRAFPVFVLGLAVVEVARRLYPMTTSKGEMVVESTLCIVLLLAMLLLGQSVGSLVPRQGRV